MKINHSVSKRLTQPLIWMAFCISAGWGASALMLAQPSFAQADSLRLQPGASPRRTQPNSSAGAGDFEVKEDKLQRCVVNATDNKKKCTDVVSGYGQIVSYGTDLYSQGNMTDAERIFRGLITAFPKEPTPYLRLGIILERQGDGEGAIEQYRKAIEINPKHAVARNSLGVTLAKQGQLSEAIDQWNEALKINAEYADALTNLGLAFLQQGKKDEGVANLKKAQELFIKRREFAKAKQVEQILQQIDSRAT
ncbi:tetratricopeptide repeat protein [Floridanema evergladense]|uniref:Tetratricopeptide repeat protein n=1 Tax=Floridaenema evergladense BLCC-F167 TaxID=3153639 RepID=A0ABV4WK70_9CYAN